MSKFQQIAVSSAINNDDEIVESLYALDEDGGVWLYEFESERWEQLAVARHPNENA